MNTLLHLILQKLLPVDTFLGICGFMSSQISRYLKPLNPISCGGDANTYLAIHIEMQTNIDISKLYPTHWQKKSALKLVTVVGTDEECPWTAEVLISVLGLKQSDL